MDPQEPPYQMPRWFFMARAIALLVIGIVILLHETLAQETAVRVVVVLSSFLLMGFSAADIASIWKRNGA